MNSEGIQAHVFEISWEVCSQVGGIYSVLRSRAPASVNCWGDGYYLIGPYRETSAKVEFEPQSPPEPIASAINEMQGYGVTIHYGRWLVTGKPQVLLIEVEPIRPRQEEIRHYFSQDANIHIPPTDDESTDIMLFGHALADFLMVVNRHLNDTPMLAHFHEWQGGAALPFLKRRERRFATVFTTHATLVGRSISAANQDLYTSLANINAEAVAFEHSIGHRFLIERAAACTADIFTTVSEVTAMEATHFLGRPPEKVLPNGLNVERFAAPHEFQVLHRQNKASIHKFVMGHFFPSYTFDLDRTLYVFTAGRYEYRNKGLDVFIESLYNVNRWLKEEGNGVTVVAFIIVPAAFHNVNVEVLRRQAMFDELNDTCTRIREDMRGRLVGAVVQGRLPEIGDLLPEHAVVRLKRMMHAWKENSSPSIVTHNLNNEMHDQIMSHLRRRGLLNHADDPVKVVFHPEFLSLTSPLMGMDYDQFVRGCNMGVFPSYYEPWGYTPLDCVIRGVPAITSDLSGFGVYVMEHFSKHDRDGIYVAPRQEVSIETTIQAVAGWIYELTQLERRERIKRRNRVEAYAEKFDWDRLILEYLSAWNMAFSKRYPGRNITPLRKPRKKR